MRVQKAAIGDTKFRACRVLHWLAAMEERGRMRCALLDLDDRLLMDIGVMRGKR